VLFKMITRQYPFKSRDFVSLKKEILRNEINFPESMDVKYVFLFKKIFQKNVDKRISVKEMLIYFRNWQRYELN
jgi:hypothetical protein